MSNGTNPPKKRGCLFYGCLTLTILAVLVVVMGLVGFFVVRGMYNRAVNEYTSTTPQAIESVAYTPAELDALQARMKQFQKALDQGKAGEELVLNAKDLNILIAEEPTVKDLKGKLFVMIEDDRIKGKVSIPLRDIGWFKLSGRYLNGLAAFRVALEGGKLDVRLEEVEVNGKPLQNSRLLGPIVTEMKNKNLAEDYQRDTRQSDNIRKFDTIQIKDGKVILKTKGQQ